MRGDLIPISVVIPVYNDQEGLDVCLASLEFQTLPKDYFRVIVVDNGSSPAIRLPALKNLDVVLTTSKKPGSFAARNHGMLQSASKYVAFLDADCVADESWLTSAYRFMEVDPSIDVTAGRIDLTFSEKMSSAECYEYIFSLRQEKVVYEYGFGFTANLIVRREAFDKFGMFDSTLKSGGDREWGQRVSIAGGRLEYVENAVVKHRARATIGELIKKRRRLEGGRAVIPKITALNSGWQPRFIVRQPRGLKMGMALLLSPASLGLTHSGGVKAFFVAIFLMLVGWVERARLLLGGQARRE